ncbi:hypothetical protein G5I_04595 [Acromyrmex echinatior]|uniref:Uncharacterized protein n=1 Tax=Acromyrmex echinatior TaxID=103372 RepID=F4WG24_ACREC|nr:hypothetical protein G5I_04595 [Acromyrmex echinatior]
MTRNIGESSEYVTKRLCFSFLFSVGFLCLLCGFLLGRFTVERSLEAQAQKMRSELAGNDRYVILSVNEDGITLALELAQVLDKICSGHNWRPRRSLIFCMSFTSSDICPQALPTFIWRRAVAYVTVHGRFMRANNHAVLFGSDIMRSIAVEAIRTIPGDNNWTYLEHEVFGPRLSLDIPQVIFSFNDNSPANNHHNQNSQLHDITLAQMVGQTIWRLSECTVTQWKPKYFNETVNEILASINTSRFQNAKEKLKKTLRILLTAVEELNAEINMTDDIQMLHMRIWNDLLLDLDKALLCPDKIDSHSRTDLVPFRKLSHDSISESTILAYLDQMTKCYEDAIEILQER